MRWNGLGCYHCLVEVDYPEASLYHYSQLLGHELSLSLYSPLSVSIIDLGDAYLLLSNMIALIDGAILSHRYLPIWV